MDTTTDTSPQLSEQSTREKNLQDLKPERHRINGDIYILVRKFNVFPLSAS